MTQTGLAPLTARHAFEDNMRPAHLLLRVYRLLDSNDNIQTEGELVTGLRKLTNATHDEELLLIYNEVFMGLVREAAQMTKPNLLRRSLGHLLRQAVVASCTAYETYLPTALQSHLPVVIRARGREFIPRNDKMVKNYFETMTFSLEDVLRLVEYEDQPEFISQKVVGFAGFSYMGTDKGLHVCGALLGIENPWREVAKRLDRDEEELKRVIREMVRRRNDIVHRADRSQTEPGGDIQEIALSWTEQAVDTVKHVIFALDETIEAKISEFNTIVTDTNG